MEIEVETLYWAGGILIFTIVALVAWGLSTSDKLYTLKNATNKDSKEDDEWKEQYEKDIGKPIKDILLSMENLEVKDLRNNNTIFDVGLCEKNDIYWTDEPDKLWMSFESNNGYRFGFHFKKTKEE